MRRPKLRSFFLSLPDRIFKLRRPAAKIAALDCRRPAFHPKKPCRLLQAFDINNRISFLIDTGSIVSVTKATFREKSKNPNSKVLYSATANEIRTCGDCVLDVNFKTPQNYSWNFTKTDLNFSIIGLDFLNAHKLTVDVHNRCLIDKENDLTIPLSPASVQPPKLCCIVPELSAFHQILAKYPNILQPPHRFE